MKNSSETDICIESVFATFFRSHAKALRNFLYYKFGQEEVAEDMTQEAFIKLWENCREIPLEKAKSFIYTVARNKSLNDLAHQKVVLEYQKKNPGEAKTYQSPEFEMEENEFKDKLLRALDKLPENLRTTFLMHRIDGMKYQEIADALELSVKAVEKRMSQALQLLRQEIEFFK